MIFVLIFTPWYFRWDKFTGLYDGARFSHPFSRKTARFVHGEICPGEDFYGVKFGPPPPLYWTRTRFRVPCSTIGQCYTFGRCSIIGGGLLIFVTKIEAQFLPIFPNFLRISSKFVPKFAQKSFIKSQETCFFAYIAKNRWFFFSGY